MTEKLIDSNSNLQAKVKELSAEHGRLSSLVEALNWECNGGLALVGYFGKFLRTSDFRQPRAKNLLFSDLSDKIKGSVNISQALSYYVHSGKPLNIQEVMIGESYYRLFMSPVRDIVEKIFIGAVVVMEDITEQKKA